MSDTIIATIITSSVTILAAFISRGYLVSQTRNATRPLGGFSRFLAPIFLHGSASTYKLRLNKAMIDNKTGLSCAFNSVQGNLAFLTVNLPDGSSRELAGKAGTVLSFEYNQADYRLTLLKVEGVTYDLRLDLHPSDSYSDRSYCLIDIRRIS